MEPEQRATADADETGATSEVTPVDGRPRTISARALVVLVVVAVVVLAVDQGAKFLVVTTLPLNEYVPVLGDVLQFFYVTNSGAAFSIGNAYTWIFSILAAAVVVFIVWFARRIRSLGWAVVFGLLLGGVLGNLGDRLFREPGFGVGHVVDFIKIPLLPAIFNLADTAICAAMAVFLVLTIRGIGLDGRRAQKPDPESTAARDDSVDPPADRTADRPAEKAADRTAEGD